KASSIFIWWFETLRNRSDFTLAFSECNEWTSRTEPSLPLQRRVATLISSFLIPAESGDSREDARRSGRARKVWRASKGEWPTSGTCCRTGRNTSAQSRAWQILAASWWFGAIMEVTARAVGTPTSKIQTATWSKFNTGPEMKKNI